jgi:hypothetical protein
MGVSEYVVDVKPSARRTNGAVGVAVCRNGTRREFDDRAAADAWATELSTRGDGHVWIRAADPADRSAVDAYLVGRYPRPRLDGAYDKRRRRLRTPSVEQAGLGEYGSD